MPLTAETTTLLREELVEHPHADNPVAPLFRRMTPTVPRPTAGKPLVRGGHAQAQQAAVLARLMVAEAEARLVLDWVARLRHGTW